ncbi:hypothetical protein M409DRAFT_23964 [Zasmidium cellare ATCC 36951]|uniref:Fungal N-terminal domain-containing protein n=1 Tax=Zasmidium cellare ATCC 36951 TaxID=1080233 RepID=A0A6A6CEP2_ZASCE|nr:uncharacterized protein M409DRAFT_23964 [Zasmidium cellare ATCC 36951]KAF2165674.1 hypothetical protein M409DRAFT_23964 [Zasmidium cellare ATCC 36951]
MSGFELLGVFSAGIQLVESIQKLKAFCGSIKNAPTTLQDLIFDLETMGLCLDQLERSQPAAHPPLLTRCLDRCRVSTSRIQVIVDKIQSVSVKRALLSRLYTALKDPDIARLLGELEQAKSTLSLSLITYNSQKQSAMENTQLARMEQQSVQLQLIWTQTQANSIALAKIPHSSVSRPTASDSDGQLRMEPSQRTYGERANSSKKAHGSHFSIRLPRWICSKIWSVSLTQAQSGWNLKLRIFTPRPAMSEVFFRCMTGDIRAVQQMIADGEASLSDCSADMFMFEPHKYINVGFFAAVLPGVQQRA